ncbi:MBL fold metallo-hydrolase [Microbacterium sp. 179-B 1A2 NHS]|uniref:MBL fold metallo-hydrolase n=1 Tax=Microbacterium sp. 179-B 1A2 NHS TaxID=3142383 RepID=UPI0039A3E8A1
MTLSAQFVATNGVQAEAWSRRALPPVDRVRDGVWAVPVPLDLPIRFTYAYLIDSPGGPLLIDPGVAGPTAQAALEKGFAEAGLDLRGLQGIVVTHYHFDHWEGADELAARTGAWIAIGEHEQGWVDGLRDEELTPEAAAARFRAHGAPEAHAVAFAGVEDYRFTRDRAAPAHRLRDGEILPVSGERLRVLWTPGHSPGHICLYDERRELLFSGDHVLPRITPHVALNPFGGDDPLGQYLDSLEALLPYAHAEVLPAHEYRFRGLRARIGQLKAGIADRLDEVAAATAADPDASAWDVARRLTWSRPFESFETPSQRMALVESAAHLAHLRARA